MRPDPQDLISDVHFSLAMRPNHRAQGLLGWVSCTIAGLLQLDSIAVRRTAAGHYALSFPTRRDAQGKRHPYVSPLDSDAREILEQRVFLAIARALKPLERGNGSDGIVSGSGASDQ